MPDCLGIRTSMSTTSGTVPAARSAAAAPSLGLADDLDVVLDVEQHRQPATEQLLVVDDDDADGLTARLGALLTYVSPRNHGTTGLVTVDRRS